MAAPPSSSFPRRLVFLRLVHWSSVTGRRLLLHHVSLGVANIERASAFYDAVLAPLGYVRVWSDLRPGEAGQAVGYGVAGGGDRLALKFRPETQSPPGPGFHLAFAAPSRGSVDRFYREALRHGGRDNGKPGLRLRYGPNYYAAFVIDPDGYNIEAVFNETEHSLGSHGNCPDTAAEA